jgi:hypothetical protein
VRFCGQSPSSFHSKLTRMALSVVTDILLDSRLVISTRMSAHADGRHSHLENSTDFLCGLTCHVADWSINLSWFICTSIILNQLVHRFGDQHCLRKLGVFESPGRTGSSGRPCPQERIPLTSQASSMAFDSLQLQCIKSRKTNSI